MCVTIICPDPCRYLTPQVWVLAVLARDVDQVGGAGMKLAERMYEDIYKYEVHLVKLNFLFIEYIARISSLFLSFAALL